MRILTSKNDCALISTAHPCQGGGMVDSTRICDIAKRRTVPFVFWTTGSLSRRISAGFDAPGDGACPPVSDLPARADRLADVGVVCDCSLQGCPYTCSGSLRRHARRAQIVQLRGHRRQMWQVDPASADR